FLTIPRQPLDFCSSSLTLWPVPPSVIRLRATVAAPSLACIQPLRHTNCLLASGPSQPQPAIIVINMNDSIASIIKRESDQYPPIDDYALVGDLHSAALISLHGSVDWLCLPRFDSPWIF